MSKKKQNKIAARQASSTAAAKKIAPVSRPSGMTGWLLVLVALLPFIITDAPLDPVLMPRYLFLSAFLFVFVAVFYLSRKRYIPLRNLPLKAKLVFWAGLAYGLWSIVSMVNSINYREGWFDTYRHGLNLVLLYVILNTILQEEWQWIRIAKTLVIVSLLQSFVGILQFYDVGFTTIPGANAKPFGLMANRNLFGSAQVFVIPFVLYALNKADKTWKWLAGISLTGLLVSIVISQTRSAWLASIALFLVALVLTIVFVPSERKKWLIGSGFALVAIVAIVSLIYLTDNTGELKSSIKERAASLTGNLGDSTNASGNITERLKIWKTTVQIIRDHAILGTGPGNWKIIMPKYGTENTQFAGGEYMPDRPHNVYLQVASETGIPGAIFYFGMWILIVLCGFAVIRKNTNPDVRIINILMIAGLAAVATDFFFSFPVDRIEHTLYMFLMGGTILGFYIKQALTEKPLMQKAGKIALGLVFLLILFNLFLGIKSYNFELAWKHSNVYNKERLYYDAIEEAASGKNNFAVMDASGAPLELFTANAYREMKNFPMALKEIEKAASYHPYNARIYSEWGTIYTAMGKYDSAIIYYKASLLYAPSYAIAIKNLAANFFTTNKDSACIAELSKINIEKEPYFQDMMRQAREALAQKAGKDSAGGNQ